MSCSVCRMPFTPSPKSMYPRWPPKDILSDKQLQYMKHAVGMGQYIVGLVVDLVNLDNNMFTINHSPMLVTIAWESMGKTFVALHTHCAMFLRHAMGLASNSKQAMVDCSLIDSILGPTQCGEHAGRFNGIDYEGILGSQRVDIESLWSIGPSEGNQDFAWNEWKRSGLEWTAARPDVFPRFRPTVLPSRLPAIGEWPNLTADRITTLPLDVLHILLPYLSNEAYVKLMATCRTLRYHALTTFQPIARERVLRLSWAVPLETEYASYVRSKHPALVELYQQLTSVPDTASYPPNRSAPSSPTEEEPAAQFDSQQGLSTASHAQGDADVRPRGPLAHVEMAHAAHSPVDGDWLHYLSQVHRTAAMRARHWSWALASEVARVYREKRAAGPYADLEPGSEAKNGGSESAKWPGKSKAWIDYAEGVGQQFEMRRLVQGEDVTGIPRFSW